VVYSKGPMLLVVDRKAQAAWAEFELRNAIAGVREQKGRSLQALIVLMTFLLVLQDVMRILAASPAPIGTPSCGRVYTAA